MYKEHAESIILDKKSTKENRIKFAGLLLKYIEVFENEIVENLYTINDSVQKKLASFKQTLENISIPDEAEEKYDAHYNGDACPCEKKDCGCVLVGDEVYHTTTGEEEPSLYTQRQIHLLLQAFKELQSELDTLLKELN